MTLDVWRGQTAARPTYSATRAALACSSLRRRLLDLAWQLVPILLLLFYLVSAPQQLRDSLRRRVWLPVSFMLLLILSLAISNWITPGGSSSAIDLPLMLLSGTAYMCLAVLYCRSLVDAERLVAFVVGAALLELPFVLLQATAWGNSLLPAGLQSGEWGGPIAQMSGSAVARYPGSFGSAELVAEFAGIAVILATGMALGTARVVAGWYWVGAVIGTFVVGFLSGTRGFLLGSAVGIVALAGWSLAHRTKNSRSALWLAGTLAGCAGLVAFVLPRIVVGGFLSRFTEQGLFGGPNALNRGLMFSTWLDLARDMPLYGYGTTMLDTALSSFSDFPIKDTHSLYFAILLTGGFAALALLLLFIGSVLFPVVRVAFRRHNQATSNLSFLMLTVILFWIVDEFKIEMIRLFFYTAIVFVVIGIGLSMREIDSRSELQPNSPPAS